MINTRPIIALFGFAMSATSLLCGAQCGGEDDMPNDPRFPTSSRGDSWMPERGRSGGASDPSPPPSHYALHPFFRGERGVRGNDISLPGPGDIGTLIDLFSDATSPAAFTIQLNTRRIDVGGTPGDRAILEWGFENSLNYAEFNIAQGVTAHVVGNKIKLRAWNGATVAGAGFTVSASIGLGHTPTLSPPYYAVRRVIAAGASSEDFFFWPFDSPADTVPTAIPANQRILPPRSRAIYVIASGGQAFRVEQPGFGLIEVAANSQMAWWPVSRSARYVKVTNLGGVDDAFEVQFQLDL